MELFGDSFGRSWSAVLGTCVPSENQKNKLVRVVEGRSKVCRHALVPAPYERNTESGVLLACRLGIQPEIALD